MNNLMALNNVVSAYMAGTSTDTSKQIIEFALDVLESKPEFQELWMRLDVFDNWWENETLEEHIETGDILIEELSGYLGEYFNN